MFRNMNQKTLNQIKELKNILQMIDAGLTGDYDITDWEYNFIQDKVIFIEENRELEDELSFSPAVRDKVDELWERLRNYL